MLFINTGREYLITEIIEMICEIEELNFEDEYEELHDNYVNCSSEELINEYGCLIEMLQK